MKKLDRIEKEYVWAITLASNMDDTDAAYDLSVGLKQYKELYKPTETN